MKSNGNKEKRGAKIDWLHVLSTICIITTGITIVMTFWDIISALSEGVSLDEYSISIMTLPRILLCGTVTGAGTDMILNGPLLDRFSGRARLTMQTVFVYAAALFFGWRYEWYDDLFGMLIMIASITGIYIFTFLINYWRQVKMAKIINKKLAELKSASDDEQD